MSELNGYTTLEEIERDHTGIRYKDVEIEGKKFQLQSLSTSDMVRLVGEIGKHPRSQNQRVIISIVSKPKFSRDQIERMAAIDAAFVGKLASACMEHAGIEAIDAVETEAKN